MLIQSFVVHCDQRICHANPRHHQTAPRHRRYDDARCRFADRGGELRRGSRAQREIAQIADRIVWLEQGCIVADRTLQSDKAPVAYITGEYLACSDDGAGVRLLLRTDQGVVQVKASRG